MQSQTLPRPNSSLIVYLIVKYQKVSNVFKNTHTNVSGL